MKKIFAIAVAGALALPSLASASVYYCNGCTPQQMYDVAWSELYSPGVRPGYVVNFANGTVVKYANVANIPDPYDPEPPPYEPNIVAQPVDSTIASLIHDLYVLTNGNTRVIRATAMQQALASKSSMHTTPDDRLPANAYESVMSPNLQQRVTDMVTRDAQDIAFTITTWAATSARDVYFDDLMVIVQFEFADGSTVMYKFDEKLKQWGYFPGTARDAHGNLIPDKKEDVPFNGEFKDVGGDTGPVDDTNWVRWLLESFGIPVVDMRSNFTSGGYVCVDGICYLQNR